MATYNPATNTPFIAETLPRFHNDSYTQSNDTIDALETRMLKAQETVAGGDYIISGRISEPLSEDTFILYEVARGT